MNELASAEVSAAGLAAEKALVDRVRRRITAGRSVDLVGISPNARSGIKGRRSDEIAGTQHVWFAYPEGHGIHSMILPEENYYVEAFRDSPVVEEYFRHCYEERKKRLGPEKSRCKKSAISLTDEPKAIPYRSSARSIAGQGRGW